MTDFEELIKEYQNETYIVTASFYAWRQINDLALSDTKIYHALQCNSLSWKVIAHSLQVTFFIALGRLFDKDHRSLTVQSFITRCRSEIKQFSKAELEVRKIKGAGETRPNWMDDFLHDVCEPAAVDFDMLIGAADRYRELYHKTFEPIRHKVFAHKDFNAMSFKDTLFAEASIAQAEEILQFIRGVVSVVNELFSNGRMTELASRDSDLTKLKNEIHADVNALLRKTIEVRE
ncbi:MAG: hypothetical protein K0R08_645 [Solimicrobium sp.]|jgi:hypothetical protein|nr:hypothetical protein [Solimicrobium sp.]